MKMDHVFLPKILTAFQGYSTGQFSRDVFAGLVVAIIAIPLSIAFGIASGVSPSQGVLTAVVGGVCISLFGGSRVQIGGPTAAFIVIVYGIVAAHGVGGLIVATFIAGVMLVIFGVLRFGSVIRQIPQPIIIGFTAGIAVTILASQLKDFFGINVNPPADFVEKLWVLAQNAGSINLWSVALASVTLFLLFFVSRVWPKIPAAFVVLTLVTTASAVMGLPVATIGSVYGVVSVNFTPLDFSGLTYSTIVGLFPAAFSIAFLAAVESLLSASVTDALIGGRHRSNTELIGQGIANIASSVVGGIPVTGAIARTAAAVRSGARTPVAGLVASLALLVIILFLGGLAAQIPMAALAGLLVHVALRMGEWKEFRLVFRTTRADALALVTTFLVTIFVDLVYAIISGLLVSSFLFIRNMALASTTTTSVENDGQRAAGSDVPHGTIVLDLSGAFFFGAASKFEESIRPLLPKARTVILRFDEVHLLDATGTRVLHRILEDARKNRVRVVMTEIQPSILQVMEHSNLIHDLGTSNLFASFEGAVKDVRMSQPLVFSTAPGEGCLDPI